MGRKELTKRLAALTAMSLTLGACSEGNSSSMTSTSTSPSIVTVPERTSPPTASQDKTPDTIYTTYLEEFCADPNRTTPIDIFVWTPDQRLPASTYVRANSQECVKRGIPVQITVSNQDVMTGQIVNGATVIRYHFSGQFFGGLPHQPTSPTPDKSVV